MSEYPKQYPTVYRDKFGEEQTIIYSDGKMLTMSLRGVEFKGGGFHYFTKPKNAILEQLPDFTFCHHSLCEYKLESRVPVQFVDREETIDLDLIVHFKSGKCPELKKGQDAGYLVPNPEILILEIEFEGQTYTSMGKHNYSTFDEQLIDLHEKLPDNIYLKSCWSCAFSDYHPVGSGCFGGLGCFSSNKKELQSAHTKSEFMALFTRQTRYVHEIHLCPEYEKFVPGVRFHYKD